MKQFGGAVLFLDRDDINTDEIIPAKYLTEISKAALKPYCLEDLKLPSFDAKRDVGGKGAIVTRANFGCGSSREHAPWALEVNGISLVVAESFARIFRQNMYNCGMIAAELPKETLDRLFATFAGIGTVVEVDLSKRELTFSATGTAPSDVAPDTASLDAASGPSASGVAASGGAAMTVPFRLSEFEYALVGAGGWVEFAARKY